MAHHNASGQRSSRSQTDIVLMGVWFIGGVATAVGHHVLYHKQHGIEVKSGSQEMNIRFVVPPRLLFKL